MISKRIYDLVARVVVGYPIPSTAQPIEMYRKWLFPECAPDEALVAFLDKRIVIDIGSGLTSQNPYSLMNVLLRAHPTAQFIGIEPRIAYPHGHRQGFSRRNIAVIQLLWFLKTLRKLLAGRKIEWGTPGKNSVVAAFAQDLPCQDANVDIAVSFFCVPYWINDPDLLLKILQEIERVLVVGGEMRMAPVPVTWQRTIGDTTTSMGQFIRSHFQFSIVKTSNNWSLAILTKLTAEGDTARALAKS